MVNLGVKIHLVGSVLNKKDRHLLVKKFLWVKFCLIGTPKHRRGSRKRYGGRRFKSCHSHSYSLGILSGFGFFRNFWALGLLGWSSRLHREIQMGAIPIRSTVCSEFSSVWQSAAFGTQRFRRFESCNSDCLLGQSVCGNMRLLEG